MTAPSDFPEFFQRDLDEIRSRLAAGRGLPWRLAQALLVDRDRWVDRAFAATNPPSVPS